MNNDGARTSAEKDESRVIAGDQIIPLCDPGWDGFCSEYSEEPLRS